MFVGSESDAHGSDAADVEIAFGAAMAVITFASSLRCHVPRDLQAPLETSDAAGA